MPGGENYREVLLTLPERASVDQADRRAQRNEALAVFPPTPESRAILDQTRGDTSDANNYKSSHWEQPNVLAHIRLDDRSDADGSKVLFVQEIQSDWGQGIKKDGLQLTPEERIKSNEPVKTAAEYQAQQELIHRGAVGLPSAPFVTKTEGWLNLALKRVVKLAIDGGYDKVAFANGEQNAAHYDLEKQVQQVIIKHYKAERGEYSFEVMGRDGSMIVDKNDVKDSEFDDYIGKELADRARKQIIDNGWASLTGIDLKIGGEGMKTFYDKIVPNTTNALLKKLGGGKVESVKIVGNESNGVSVTREMKRDQPGFAITDAMRERAADGIALFSVKRKSDLSELESDQEEGATKKKYRKYDGMKASVQVRIEDTGEVATLVMDVGHTLEDFDNRQDAMKKLIGCLA